MTAPSHLPEASLALYVSGDLTPWSRGMAALHLSRCRRCRERMEAFRADRAAVRAAASSIPEGLNWDRLAAEMTANIRVGLAAGECVAPRKRKPAAMGWRPAAAMAGLAGLLVGAWWLNMPPSSTQALGRAISAIWNGHGSVNGYPAHDGRGLVVELSSAGIELRENGSTVLGVSQDQAKLVDVSVSVQGSASARYVDDKTGQMTITSVYAQ